MDEAKFVLKCFAFAALLLLISQLKTKSGTIETDIQAVLVSSQTADFINKAADGGTQLLKDSATYLKKKYNEENNQSQKANNQSQKANNQDMTSPKSEFNNNHVLNKKTASQEAAVKKTDLNEEPIEEIE